MSHWLSHSKKIGDSYTYFSKMNRERGPGKPLKLIHDDHFIIQSIDYNEFK
jgi:hypothetical protein